MAVGATLFRISGIIALYDLKRSVTILFGQTKTGFETGWHQRAILTKEQFSREGRKIYYEIADPHLLELLVCMEKKFGKESYGKRG